jgi:glycosyltransferase involved in cell wall biosynthesis
MQVLVYGEWEKSSKNSKSFFTATYLESQKKSVTIRELNGTINFIFVGSLTAGKRAFYTVKLIEVLHKKGFNVSLNLYGYGEQFNKIEKYIKENNLESFVFLEGNKTQEDMILVYCKSHFLVLPSKSEGWPKVVAEAMFWGCVPIATPISCIPNMIDNENRGMLLSLDLVIDVHKIICLINNKNDYKIKAENGLHWSRNFTLDYFETEIKKMLL